MTKPKPPFDHCLFALSTISHRLEYPRPLNHASSVQKHLKLLNLLALLMITEPKGDVAATTLIRTTTSVTILYSKNRPCTPSESSYIQTLQDIITSATRETTEETRLGALSLIIKNCSKKIKARLNKLVKQLKLGFIVKPPPPETSALLCKTLQPTGFPSHIPFEKSITHWLTSLMNDPTSALTSGNAIGNLFIAYGIGYTQDIESVIDDPVLLRRLQKLGDYFAAVRCLVAAYIGLEPDLTITFHEIVPPPPEIITLKYDVLATVNAWARHKNHQPLTPESLHSAYPSLTLSSLSAPPGTVKTSVHAECTLLTYLLTLNLPFLELGTSKNVCWTCESFITGLRESYTGVIHFSRSQGKVHAGWRFPEGTSAAVKVAVEESLSHEMDSVLARASMSTRSDSEPDGSDEGEEDYGLDLSKMMTKNPWLPVE